MKVTTPLVEYTLYIDERGLWTLHAWKVADLGCTHWLFTVKNVSARDPFASTVEYDAWR